MNTQSIQLNQNGDIYLLKDGFGLAVKEAGQWNHYPIPGNYASTNLKRLEVGDEGLSWITGPSQQGILLFQKQNNQAVWRQLNSGKGSGNLPSMEVTAITKAPHNKRQRWHYLGRNK